MNKSMPRQKELEKIHSCGITVLLNVNLLPLATAQTPVPVLPIAVLLVEWQFFG
jgi:hypothetical protein